MLNHKFVCSVTKQFLDLSAWKATELSVYFSTEILQDHSGFSIILYFLQNPASIDGKEKIKKNCPNWRLNLQPPDHHSNALLTVLDRNLLGRRFLK